jgi:Flp pilus assembly protein TadB
VGNHPLLNLSLDLVFALAFPCVILHFCLGSYFINIVSCLLMFKTRQGEIRQDKTRQNKTRQEKTRHNKNMTRQDKIKHNITRQDKTRQDKARQGKVRHRLCVCVCVCCLCYVVALTCVTLLSSYLVCCVSCA